MIIRVYEKNNFPFYKDILFVKPPYDNLELINLELFDVNVTNLSCKFVDLILHHMSLS